MLIDGHFILTINNTNTILANFLNLKLLQLHGSKNFTLC